MVKLATSLGFVKVRQVGGSHAIYKHVSDHRRTTIPIHSRKSLKRKTIKSIIEDMELTLPEFKELLKS